MPGVHEKRLTFRRHDIHVERDGPDSNWYIRVRAPDGLHTYDGWWRDSAGRSVADAITEAKAGSCLTAAAATASPVVHPTGERTASSEGPRLRTQATVDGRMKRTGSLKEDGQHE